MDDVRLEASGLFLDPSELTAPPGSMREALNVRIRRQNIVEPRPGFARDVVDDPQSAGRGRAVFSWGDSLYAVFGRSLWLYNRFTSEIEEVLDDVDSLDIDNDKAFFEPMGRSGYVVTTSGVYRIDEPGGKTAVRAGIPDGLAPDLRSAVGSGVPDGSHVAVRVLFGETVNGQLLLGAPGPPITYEASGSARAVSVIIPLSVDVRAGMVAQIYRTDVVVVASPTGDEMALVASVAIEAADITAGFVQTDILLTTAEVLGASLYTNETQEGILQAAYPPPEASCIAWWKQMAFYGDLHPRYPNYVQSTSLNVSEVDAIGNISDSRFCNTTSGSPVITGLTASHSFSVGQYLSQSGNPYIAGSLLPALSRIIARTDTTVTINQNATGTAAFVELNSHGVLTVGGVEFINGFKTDIASKQFGSRGGLASLVAAETGLSLSISDYESTVFDMTWMGEDAFSISYVGRFPLVGVYGTTPVLSVADVDGTPSRVAWSKTLQPEAVPLLQFQDIGDWRSPIMRLIPTRDSLFVLKGDGVWRITGDSPDTLRVEEFDRSQQLIHRRAADAFDNQVIAWTRSGVVAISEAGITRLSDPAIAIAIEPSQENIIRTGLSSPPAGCFITGCIAQECVMVGVPSASSSGASATAEYVYVWESRTGAWVRWAASESAFGWRAGVEHTGEIVLAAGEASLSFQDADTTDLVEAVTVTLASASSATIAALADDGVGCRVTQGGVTAWLTESLGASAYTTTATLANGAATVSRPVVCEVEWNASPTPGATSHWRQLRAQLTTLMQSWRVRFGFTSERSQTLGEVWQDFTDPVDEQGVIALRVYVTRAHARCARLRPRMTIASAGQRWLLNGVTLTYEPMRDGNRLP